MSSRENRFMIGITGFLRPDHITTAAGYQPASQPETLRSHSGKRRSRTATAVLNLLANFFECWLRGVCYNFMACIASVDVPGSVAVTLNNPLSGQGEAAGTRGTGFLIPLTEVRKYGSPLTFRRTQPSYPFLDTGAPPTPPTAFMVFSGGIVSLNPRWGATITHRVSCFALSPMRGCDLAAFLPARA